VSTPQQLSAFNNFVIPRYTIKNISAGGSYTVTGADNGVILNFIGSVSLTLNLAPAASLGPGFNFQLWNSTSGTAVTVDPNGAEYINGTGSNADSTYIMYGGTCQFTTDGVRWRINNFSHVGTFGGSVVIGNGAYGTNSNTIAIGQNAAASSPYTIALGYGAQASASYTTAIGYNVTASSNYSTAIGTNSAGSGSQAVTGSGAMALGGSYASGADSFAAAIADNTSTYGAKIASGVAIGYHAIASNQIGNIAIGYQATSTSTRSIALGYTATASGTGSVAIGGYAYGATVTGTYGIAIGDGCNIGASATAGVAIGWYNTLSTNAIASVALGNENQSNDVAGKITYGPTSIPGNGVPAGRAKWGNQVVFADTSNATPKVLTTPASTGSTAASHSTIIGIENNTAYAYSILVVARQAAANGTSSAAWEFKGLARREGTAASTVIVNNITTTLSNQPGWSVALSADTTNGGLSITATGGATANVRWTATAQTSEVTYA